MPAPPPHDSIRRLNLHVLVPAIMAVILEAEVARSGEVSDFDLVKLVVRAVRSLADLFEFAEVDIRNSFSVQDDRDLRPLGRDRHVVPLADGLLGIDLRRFEVVKRAGVVHAGAGRVVDRDLKPRVDGVFGLADAEEHAGVATLRNLVVEVEHEVSVRLFVDHDVSARLVRVEAVGLDVRLREVAPDVQLPAG